MKLNSKSINYNVQTVDELVSLDGLEGDTVVVTDENRGGVFVYREDNALVNNGGTIFNGWTRQYDGAVNVKWFGIILNDITKSTSNTAILQNIPYSEIFIPSGNLYIDSNTILPSGITVKGEAGSVLIGDGDLFVDTFRVYFDNITIKNNISTGKLFSYTAGGAIGRSQFRNCTFGKSDYHFYSLRILVDYVFEDCVFEYASIASRYFSSLWAYKEKSCYTWQGAKGLVVTNANLSSCSIYGCVYEVMTDTAIEYNSNTASGELNNFLISGTHFEKNGNITGNADIVVNITGATRARNLTVQSCGFFSPPQDSGYSGVQTERIKINITGGGSAAKLIATNCQVHGSVTICNNTSYMTVIDTDLSSTSLGSSVLSAPRGKQEDIIMTSGTWTPIDRTLGLTLTVSDNKYVRIGNMVTVKASILYPSTEDATACLLGGLPYSCGNSARDIGCTSSTSSTLYNINVLPMNASTDFRLYKTPTTRVIMSELSSNTIHLSFSYFIS